MDEDQFAYFVRFARKYFSSQELYLKSTAAQGRALAYLEVHHPRGDREEYLDRLIRESASDKSSWDALNFIAQDLLLDGKRLPAELAKWTVDVLADGTAKRGEERRPRPAKGSDDNAGRDWNYYFYICRLRDRWNLTPTRNETSDARSGCDVVAAAKGEHYKTIAGIWTRRSDEMRKASV